MPKPIVAIVGRPNVGKSTLFNKLTGERTAIVDDVPGVTRDRLYGECEWSGKRFTIVDTGGIECGKDDVILSQMVKQAQVAIESAQVIIFVTDLKSGVVAMDQEVAQMLQKSGKPIVLCVNKCDSVGNVPVQFYEFYNLGLGDPFPVSSVHGHGTGDMLDQVLKYFNDDESQVNEDGSIRVAIIGKPNVGKSSLVNKLSNEERCIVSDIAGTTRDTTDTVIENEYGKFTLVDTAGMRKRSKVNENVEHYSFLRAKMAIDKSDVCVIMIDAQEGFTEQDSKVAGLAHEAGKACIIAVNKWDTIAKNTSTMNEYKKKLEIDFSFMSYAPIMFISAKTGQRLKNLLELIVKVSNYNSMRISTSALNDILSVAVARVQPPSDKGKRLKIFYMTQVAVKPPTFLCFVNSNELFHFSYKRYIENQIRCTFGMEGTPIRILSRERMSKKGDIQ